MGFLTFYLVLWRERHRILLFSDLPGRWIRSHLIPDCITGLRDHQLDICPTSSIHHRYIRSQEPPADDLSSHVHLSFLHRLLVPHQRQNSSYCSHGVHCNRHLPFWHCLFTRRRPGAIHIFCRGVPIVRSYDRHVSSYVDHVVLQLPALDYVAEPGACIHHYRCFLLVCRVEHRRILARSFLLT